MTRGKHLLSTCAVLLIAMTAANDATVAASDSDALQQEVAALKAQMADLTGRLDAGDRATTKWDVTGYADAGFVKTDADGEEDHFSSGHFNPAFHFQYGARVFFEAELEIETGEDGATEIAIEYNSISLGLTDNATLVMGKWLSPVGQFQERLHPS